MNKYILVIVLVLASLVSCSEDFLEKVPLDKISSDNFEPGAALVGVYDALQHWYVSETDPYYESLTPMTQMRVEYGGFKSISLGAHDAFSSTARNLWSQCYNGIFRANDFLEKLEDIEMDETLRTHYMAEARFIRAYMYYRLVNVFGNVVYLDYVPEIEEGRSLVQSTRAEVVEKIHEDLNYAISILPVDQEDIGRITQGAALGLKARVYLYDNDFQNVQNTCNDIFDLNKYDLEPTLAGIFDFQNENNDEVVFDIQYVGPGLGEGSTIEHLMGTKDRDRNGWFHNAPTKFIVDMYETTDGTPVDPLNPYANRDPRFYRDIFYPGSTIYGTDFNSSVTYRKLKTKFAVRKFIIEDDGSQTNAVMFDAPNNIIIIRYADILLMAAEAENELNGPTNAYGFINDIRTRAGMPDLATGLSQEEMRAAIHKERMIELAFEGLHFFDMKRWMTPVEIKAYIENNQPQDFEGSQLETRLFDITNNKHMLWPIPQVELDNVPTLEPNPGW